jgi:hypothetical protein
MKVGLQIPGFDWPRSPRRIGQKQVKIARELCFTQRTLGFIRRQKRAFKVNIVRNILQYFSIGLTYQYQSVYISELGASAMEIGYANSVGGLVSTLITLPVGWLADRYGIKRMLLTAFPLMALDYAVFGLAQGWEITMVALVLTSLSTNMVNVVCPMICGNTLASAENCVGCGECEAKCPYALPIREMITENIEYHRKFMEARR